MHVYFYESSSSSIMMTLAIDVLGRSNEYATSNRFRMLNWNSKACLCDSGSGKTHKSRTATTASKVQRARNKLRYIYERNCYNFNLVGERKTSSMFADTDTHNDRKTNGEPRQHARQQHVATTAVATAAATSRAAAATCACCHLCNSHTQAKFFFNKIKCNAAKCSAPATRSVQCFFVYIFFISFFVFFFAANCMADTQHKDDDASNRKCKWATNAMHMHKKWKRLNCRRERCRCRPTKYPWVALERHFCPSSVDGPHEIWLNIVNAKSYERLTGGRPKKSVFGAVHRHTDFDSSFWGQRLTPTTEYRWMWKSATATPSRHNATHWGHRAASFGQSRVARNKGNATRKGQFSQAGIFINQKTSLTY